MTIGIIAIIVIAVLASLIFQGEWLWALLLIIIISCSSAQYATDVKLFWNKLTTTRVSI